MKEEIYESSVKFKSKFLLQDFYEKFKEYLESLNWNGKFGKDYYESYHYFKLSPEGLYFIEYLWELEKEFWKEEPKIKWELILNVKINAYNINTQTGEMIIDIKSSHEIEEVKIPEKKTFFEEILSLLGFSQIFLKKEYAKRRIKESKIVKISGKYLYSECEKIREWILNYFRGYY